MMATLSESLTRLHFVSLLLICFVSSSSSLTIIYPLDGLVPCRPHQIQALTEFKNEFDSRSCNQTEYFNGVWCDNTTSAITKLQLPSGCFTGILKSNSSLFRFHQLRYLNLSYNNFTSSSLPFGFGNLNKLEVLSLSSNGFIGQVPSSFSNLSMLSYLDISFNGFTGGFPLVWNLSRLSFLELSCNYFSGTLNPNSNLFELRQLRYLNLGFNNFTSSLPYELGNLNRLEYLYLSSNGFLGQVPPTISNLTSLTILDLSKNQFTGSFPLLQNLTKLSRLILFYNYFTSFEGRGEALDNSSVRILELARNHFKGPFPKPPLSINFLSAWNNSFTGNIPISVCNRSSLTLLDLSYNNFTGSIPQCLSNIQDSLIVVNLRKNNLEGSLPDMCHDAASLRTLDVGYNQLAGKLPRSLMNCSSLKFVSLDHNKISDIFPFWLKNLPDLQVLTLRSNKFYGPIYTPDQGPLAFPKLRILEISDNNFTGSLPSNFFVNWKAASLKMDEHGKIYMGDYNNPYFFYEDTIDLQYKGLFMEQQKVLTAYATIDFSGNKLEGQIPESIGLLKALIALNLSNNEFTGHIPLSLANVTELESLDLSNNHLSGTIPNGLRSLSFLAYISVAHNQLKGEIPQGTQIIGQSKSSFEGNAGLCGLPLVESCFEPHAPPTQHHKQEEEEEEEEQVLSWKAVVMGYGIGVLFGVAIAQFIASYKPEWLAKIVGLKNRINR